MSQRQQQTDQRTDMPVDDQAFQLSSRNTILFCVQSNFMLSNNISALSQMDVIQAGYISRNLSLKNLPVEVRGMTAITS